MAEVLSPLPSPSSTINMLHTRPSSSSDAYQSNHQRVSSTPRTVYRGSPSTTPVQPYAFQATPQLRQDNRPPSSSSAATQIQQKPGHRSTSSTSTTSSADVAPMTKSPPLSPGKDAFINLSSSIPDLSLTSFDATPKSSPNRYRRSPQRLDSSSSLQKAPSPSSSTNSLLAPPVPTSPLIRTASDDLTITKSSTSETAKRYRRRSLNNMDVNKLGDAATRPSSQGNATIRPVSFHSRTSSGDSIGRQGSTITPPPESDKAATSGQTSPVKLAVRSTATNPSPLSRSHGTSDTLSPTDESPRRMAGLAPSPAAQHLASLSERDLNKGVRSRLRRAFSFGANQELRQTGENIPSQSMNPLDEMDPEQAAIARRQEAAGIGSSIYTGQGGFTGSTDNLSISSTASSASIMLRKMGKGMKKGGRSLKGLFRPKSVIGVPAADGPIQASSMAQVSMVTVEAERQNVNVNAHPAEQHAGGTGFPKLEKNSIDMSRNGLVDTRSSNDRNDSMRKSIVGNDRERAEVLAAVKKGILKRSATGSPGASPDLRPRDAVPAADSPHTHSPASSMPTTPRDDRGSRSMSSTTSDYFSGRLGVSAAKSMPNTPGNRNISFSPRIQFYDAWSASDYDRRGEIATCNRLTPMLAQQIKEELNTFKMEMEVHEMSKPHTHFF